MDRQQLDLLFRQRQAHPGFSVSNEKIVLLPFPGDHGMQLAAAYAATVTDADQRQCTVVFGYATTKRTEAARNPDADDFFFQLGNPFLEGAYDREKAAMRCAAATQRAWVPKYPVQGRFAQLQQEHARIGQLMAELQTQMHEDGDFLTAEMRLQEMQTVLGVMQLRASHLPQTREMKDIDALPHAAAAMTESVMRNYACYPAATIAPFMPTKSQPLVSHPSVQHGLSVVASTDVLVHLKRHYRQAHQYLSTGSTGL